MPLPPGLSLNKLTGIISGTPTVAGTYAGTLRVRDAQGTVRDQAYSITVAAYTPPVILGTPGIRATRTVAYSAALTIQGGTGVAPFTWSVASGVLPTGVTLNASTGLISGTPTDTTYTDRALTIRVVDSTGSSAQLSYTLNYRNRIATSSVYPAATVDTPYDFTPVLVGGHATISWVLTGSLPSGLSFNTTTGRISGTPTAPSTPSITATVTDGAGLTAAISQTFTVNASYTPVSLTGGLTGVTPTFQKASGTFTLSPATNTLVAADGLGSYTYSWARISGSANLAVAAPSSLTSGFNLTIAAGANESAVFRLTATDGTTSATYDITVSGNNTYVFPTLTGTPDQFALQGKAYSASFTRANGLAPFSFVVTVGTLPTGIALDGTTGAMVGTPTDASFTDRGITVRVTDAEGQTATASFTLQYKGAISMTGTPPQAYRTRPYTFTPVLAGGYTPVAYTLQSGALPTGTSLNSTTGVVSGTTSTVQTSNYTLRGTDARGNVSDFPFTTTVNAYTDVGITSSYPNEGTVNLAYNGTPNITNGLGPFAFDISAGALPAGLAINASTGAITGTPTTSGSPSATVRVTDALGVTATVPLSWTIFAVVTASLTTPTGYTGIAGYSGSVNGGGGKTPRAFSIVAGALPTGLSLNTSTGAITGTPTGATTTFTARVTDALGAFTNVAGGITIASPVQLGNRTITTYRLGAGALTATYNLNSGGSASGAWSGASGSGDGSYSPDWLLFGANSAYEARMTVSSGSFSTGTVGTWEVLSSTRTWTRARAGATGVDTVVGTLEIRPTGGGATLASCTITLTAEREN